MNQQNKTMPTIDILIAAYNVKGYIEKTIESVIKQTYPNIHVIIGDDGSTDGTLEYLRTIVSENHNMELLELEHAGLINVRKKTIEKATATYTIMLDGDDYLTDDCVEVLYNHLVQNDLDIAIGDYYRQSPNYTFVIPQNYKGTIQGDQYIQKILLNQITSYVWGRIYKRELLNNINFPLEIHHSEDRVINLQIALKNPKVGYIHTPVCYYVKRTSSLAHVVMPLAYVKMLTATMEQILESKPHIRPWIVTMKIGVLLLNINSSKSPDVSKDEWVTNLYKEIAIPQNKQIYRKALPQEDRIHLALYKNSGTHWLAHAIKAVKRICKSIAKRFKSKKSKD